MTRRCSRIRSAATAFMTAAREACRELRCMVEAINADRAARPFLIASKNCLACAAVTESVSVVVLPQATGDADHLGNDPTLLADQVGSHGLHDRSSRGLPRAAVHGRGD